MKNRNMEGTRLCASSVTNLLVVWAVANGTLADSFSQILLDQWAGFEVED